MPKLALIADINTLLCHCNSQQKPDPVCRFDTPNATAQVCEVTSNYEQYQSPSYAQISDTRIRNQTLRKGRSKCSPNMPIGKSHQQAEILCNQFLEFSLTNQPRSHRQNSKELPILQIIAKDKTQVMNYQFPSVNSLLRHRTQFEEDQISDERTSHNSLHFSSELE